MKLKDRSPFLMWEGCSIHLVGTRKCGGCSREMANNGVYHEYTCAFSMLTQSTCK